LAYAEAFSYGKAFSFAGAKALPNFEHFLPGSRKIIGNVV
jgi:hypothetical protein